MSGIEIPISILAVISLTDRLLSSIRDAPRDIQLMEIDMFHLRGLMGTIRSLTESGALGKSCLDQLYGPCRETGLVAILGRHLVEMDEKLQPQVSISEKSLHFGGSKPPRCEFSWQTITWPAKRKRMDKLLGEIQSVMHRIGFLIQQDIKYDTFLECSLHSWVSVMTNLITETTRIAL